MEHIGEIEKKLWSSADTLRANSNFTSNEYLMPVMGLIFLLHACSRFLTARDEIIPTLPSRGSKTHPLKKEDFAARSAIVLQPEAQFEHHHCLLKRKEANNPPKSTRLIRVHQRTDHSVAERQKIKRHGLKAFYQHRVAAEDRVNS